MVLPATPRSLRTNSGSLAMFAAVSSPLAFECLQCASRRSVYDEVENRSERDGRLTHLHRAALLQHPHQSPTVQWQEDDMQDQYGRQVQQKSIRDEGYVAANGGDAKVDHVL